jgi:hypothetical protein
VLFGHLGSGIPSCGSVSVVGQRSLKVTADIYTHVLMDERELDYAELLGDLFQKVSQLPS